MLIRFPVWLGRVLIHGESVQADTWQPTPEDRAPAVALLREAYLQHVGNLAGSPLAFEEDVAWQAALLLSDACWHLVSDDTITRIDEIRTPAITPASLFSADLTLRFLPSVLRRAAARSDRAELANAIETVLRRWPLSGVLADLDGEPAGDTTFCGHAGLQMLYAERLLKTGRAGWIPIDGLAREWVERIFAERGKPLPTIPKPAEDDLG